MSSQNVEGVRDMFAFASGKRNLRPHKMTLHCAICDQRVMGYDFEMFSTIDQDALGKSCDLDEGLRDFFEDVQAVSPEVRDMVIEECRQGGISHYAIFLNGIAVGGGVIPDHKSRFESCPGCNAQTERDKRVHERLIEKWVTDDDSARAENRMILMDGATYFQMSDKIQTYLIILAVLHTKKTGKPVGLEQVIVDLIEQQVNAVATAVKESDDPSAELFFELLDGKLDIERFLNAQ